MLKTRSSHKLATMAAIALAIAMPVHAQSEADCAARADRATRDSSGIVGGAMYGAAGGAVFGAIVGDSRKSARRGAALGAVVGGAHNAYRDNDTYRRVYDDCMAGRNR